MLDGNLPFTLQYQLKTKLLEHIGQGVWRPGDKIPSEWELCEEYGVSRMTVREVLKDLVLDGKLTRKQGKGTFVSQPKIEHRLTSFYSFSEEIRKTGLTPHAKVLELAVAKADVRVAKYLSLPAGESVHRLVRLRYIEDDLFAYERSYIPHRLAHTLNGKQIEKSGLYRSLTEVFGLVPDEAEEDFEAINCPKAAADLLEIKPGTAVLCLNRLTYAAGEKIEYCQSIIRADKYKYKIVLGKR